ncbi:hypothetical protein RXV95_07715 [Novosphingobium sp. ZN18A2]|uniref:glucosamine inositolphosphorylceramide transferase family protein n=1 Tax=Novosphingobium sp. ZN18A2 TaxID=3079861 RepID=UPI0030CD989C
MTATPLQPPLRVALVMDDVGRPPDWVMRLATRIHADRGLRLTALIQPRNGTAGRPVSPLLSGWFRLERRFAARSEPADSHAYLQAVECAKVVSEEDRPAIEAARSDVIIDLTSGAGRGIDPGLALHGVWFIDSLDPRASVASLLARSPVSRLTLLRRTSDHSAPAVVAAASLNPKYVAARNALFMSEKSVQLIMRALRRTRSTGRPDSLADREVAALADPTAGQFSRYLWSLARHSTRRAVNDLRARMGHRPGQFILKSAECGWDEFDASAATAHIPDGNRYFADPFLWDRDGQTYCFFEEFDYRKGRGHISAGRFEDGQLTDVGPVIQTAYHLSFPFLFEADGQLYMLPETSEKRRLEVWKCIEFPDRWERHATALEGIAASDSTINLIGGEWWLFTNISTDPFLEMNSELHVFRVDGPDLAKLEPHSFNPVVFNSRSARNAGRILEMDGRLYRPAQDNSHGYYGYGLRLMEIRRLSMDDYEEVEVRQILPDFEPGIIGCHHLDIRDGRVIIDVRKKVGARA